jgi:hypothetical protein
MVKEIVVDAKGVTFTSSGEPISQPLPYGILGNSTDQMLAYFKETYIFFL